MKRWTIGLCLLVLAFGSSAIATEHSTTQSASYVFSGFFVEDCDLGLGVACFTIGRDDVSTVRVQIDDASPFPITGHISVYGPGGSQIGGSDQFCESADLQLPAGLIYQIVVHAGGFSETECGPIIFIDPFEQKEGWLSPPTTGTVTITY